MKIKHEYPKMRYHADYLSDPKTGCIVVHTPDEDAALGPEWKESPANLKRGHQ